MALPPSPYWFCVNPFGRRRVDDHRLRYRADLPIGRLEALLDEVGDRLAVVVEQALFEPPADRPDCFDTVI
jgi:hypothetical protein